MSAALSIAVPALLRETNAGLTEYAAGEVFSPIDPVVVHCGPARHGDGTVVEPIAIRAAGLVVTRLETSGGPEQVWSSGESRWIDLAAAFPGGRAAEGVELGALEVADDAAISWSGLAVLGDPKRYARAELPVGYPRFAMRCYLEAVSAGETVAALGSRSLALPVSAASPFLAMLDAEPDTRAPRWLRLYMMDPSRRLRSEVVLRRDSMPEGITLRTFSETGETRARVRLHPNGTASLETRPDDVSRAARIELTASGDVRITPAPGRAVLVDGDVNVQGALYEQGARVRTT